MTATDTANQTALSAKSLMQILNLSKRQIFRLKSAGKLPRSLKIGGSVRWLSTDIHSWLGMGCPSMLEFEARKENNNHA